MHCQSGWQYHLTPFNPKVLHRSYSLCTMSGMPSFNIVFLSPVLSCKSPFYHAQPSIALAFPSTSVLYLVPHSRSLAYHLKSLSSFLSVSSSRCMVFASDRDVFCPTAICSCVSVFLSQDCSWGLLSFVEDEAAEEAC